jgi:hypothetical protein
MSSNKALSKTLNRLSQGLLLIPHRNLRKEGHIQVIDIAFPIQSDDGSLPANSQLKEWSDMLLEASIQAGKPLDSAKAHRQQLENAGFKDIVERQYKWPQNDWEKEKYLKDLGI